jgi:signal transduction histidine kinase
VLRSLRSWTERLLPCGGLLAIGVVAEWSGWSRPGSWVPDLLTGWVLCACGLVAWARASRGPGALLVTAGTAWFVPNFTPHLLFLHRGPLIQLVLAYPHGRPRRRWEAIAAIGGWVLAIATFVWLSAGATVAIAGLLVLLAVLGFRSSVGLERRERSYGVRCAVFLAAVLAVPAALHLLTTASAWGQAAPRLYEVGLMALAAFLLWGLLRAPWERVPLTDLVVQLGEARAPTLRDALARALGDPSLEVGYWVADAGEFVDPEGRPLALPADGDGRSTTVVDREGKPAAVLVHDHAVLGDPSLIEAVASAAKLGSANARLQAELHARVVDVAASRRRILVARDEERERLEGRLREGARRRLDQLAALLADARRSAVSPVTIERVANSEQQLVRTRDELTRFARGIHPRELTEQGLVAALRARTVELPLTTQLDLAPLTCSPALESCLYFVCSEALTNVVKYASASSVAVSLAASGELVTLRIEDDGVGGANTRTGSGLRGLDDRVEALGGTLTLDSPPGAGTRLTAVLPMNA